MQYEIVPGPICRICGKEVAVKDTDFNLYRIGIYQHIKCELPFIIIPPSDPMKALLN